jgi:hypothetical protein
MCGLESFCGHENDEPTTRDKQPVTVIYTPASNILKRGDYATGSVSFHNDRLVQRLWNRFPRHALRHANIDVRT